MTGSRHVFNVEGDVVDRSQHSSRDSSRDFDGDFSAEIDRVGRDLGDRLSHHVFLKYTNLPEVTLTLGKRTGLSFLTYANPNAADFIPHRLATDRRSFYTGRR